MTKKHNTIFVNLIRYTTYPVFFLFMAWYAFISVSGPIDNLGQYHFYYLVILVGTMLLIEHLHPLKRKWRMTKATFFKRDLPYMFISGTTMVLVQLASGWLIIWLGLARGESHSEMALLPSVIIILLIVDFLWYWVHRWSHEGKGAIGRWLWRIHVAHHLPQQVYVLMHGVSHPLNVLIVRALFTAPLFFLGFSTEALFVSNLIIGLQGMVSHFNIDMRVGHLNYLLMGTELHRYHHSTNPEDAKNYGSTIVLWDIIFGTYLYRPDAPPENLGVSEPDRYPEDIELLNVMKLPFHSK